MRRPLQCAVFCILGVATMFSADVALAGHRGNVELISTVEASGQSEIPVEAWLGVPAGSLLLAGPITDGVEFINHLDRWTIDVSEDVITFDASVSDTSLGAEAVQRHYLTFGATVTLESAASVDEGVDAEVDGRTVVITITTDYDHSSPGFIVAVSIATAPAELTQETVSTPFAITAALVLVVGSLLAAVLSRSSRKAKQG